MRAVPASAPAATAPRAALPLWRSTPRAPSPAVLTPECESESWRFAEPPGRRVRGGPASALPSTAGRCWSGTHAENRHRSTRHSGEATPMARGTPHPALVPHEQRPVPPDVASRLPPGGVKLCVCV